MLRRPRRRYTFQAILYPNGTIIYQYQDDGWDAAERARTIGIQNATRDDGLTVVYNDDYVHDDLAIRLAHVAGLADEPHRRTAPCLRVTSANIQVTFDAAGLFGGEYEGAVRIESNDPANGLIDVPAAPARHRRAVLGRRSGSPGLRDPFPDAGQHGPADGDQRGHRPARDRARDR